MATLRITNGPGADQSVSVTGEMIIGRENADVTVADAEVSRRHAAVRLIGDRVEIEDLGSANGTFVNGSRITGPVTVGGGATIRIGQTELEVRGVVPTPAVIADPQVTQARAIPDPQITRARPIADPQVTQARAIADPQVTQARAIPDPQVTKPRPIADPQVTRARPVAEPQVTRARAVPEPAAPAAPTARAPRDVPAEVGSFSPAARRGRRRGLASRSWVPAVASFASAGAAAAALVVYFIVHGVPS